MDALLSPGTYIASISGGRKTVAVAGVPERLSSTEVSCTGVIIQALRTNSGNVAVCGSDVSVQAGGESGISLVAGQTITLFMKDLKGIWIDSANNNEGVSYLTLKG